MRIEGKTFVKEYACGAKSEAKKYAAKARSRGRNARVVWKANKHEYWVVTR